MNKTFSITVLAVLVLVASASCGATKANAQSFDITWYTVDAGGGYSSGGNFELEGTIGQHDAGTTMTGGSFEWAGGFWAGISGPPVPGPLGDANGDGMFNNLDIASFVLALTNLPAYQAMFPDVDTDVVLDMNDDGVFNNSDIAGFVAALTGE